VVALIEPPFTIEPDPFEVAEVFEVPLAFLMAPANHRRHGVDAGGRASRVLLDAVAKRSARFAPLLHLGRYRGDAAQLLSLSRRLRSRARRRYDPRAMSFFAVLFALLIEQLKPLPRTNPVHDALTQWMRWTGRNFDAGKPHHAWVVWSVTVIAPSLLAWLVYVGLVRLNLLAGMAWDVAVLYVTLGFRQFSHHFTDIRDALDRGDEQEARRLLPMASPGRERAAAHGAAAPHHRALAAGRRIACVRRVLLFVVMSSVGLGPAGAAFLPDGRVRQPLLGHKTGRWASRSTSG
jgi:hypothetical protein